MIFYQNEEVVTGGKTWNLERRREGSSEGKGGGSPRMPAMQGEYRHTPSEAEPKKGTQGEET